MGLPGARQAAAAAAVAAVVAAVVVAVVAAAAVAAVAAVVAASPLRSGPASSLIALAAAGMAIPARGPTLHRSSRRAQRKGAGARERAAPALSSTPMLAAERGKTAPCCTLKNEKNRV